MDSALSAKMGSALNDRGVEVKGDHLKGRKIEFVVSGGIAGIESPRIVRELRRHGAQVRVWMTRAATEFVNPRVFEWASGHPVITDLSGAAEHISSADAAVLAPATLDFISKLSLGIADSAALTMLQSILGRQFVFVVPSMHESLSANPIYKKNLSALSTISKISLLDPVYAESKLKMLSPEELVARVCHQLAHGALKNINVAISVGPTRSYADSVRFLSNRSSGALGLAIADELYRSGANVSAVCGPLQVLAPSYIEAAYVETNDEMRREFLSIMNSRKPSVAIFSAAVLDFEIEGAKSGKVSSTNHWDLKLNPSPKLIEAVRAANTIKVGFKLECDKSVAELKEIAKASAAKNECAFLVANRFEEVSSVEHRAWIYDRADDSWVEAQSKIEIARLLRERLEKSLKSDLGLKAHAVLSNSAHAAHEVP